jgi:hypothetical protein
MTSELFDKGLRIRTEVLGETYVQKALASMDDVNRPLQELVTEYCCGQVSEVPVRDPIPLCPVDIFSRESVRQARAVDDTLREFSPVVRLPDGTVMISRHASVSAGLVDWKTFSSTSRPWHDPKSVRPEILLTDDPPRHTHVRAAMAKALSPALLEGLRASFERDAATIVGCPRFRRPAISLA